jgi:hypothetical protein
MALTTNSFGIFQSDLIIRSALMKGLQHMRNKPWLLDYCFASLPKDEETAKLYGQKTVDQAKAWFLEAEIPVFMNTRVDPTKYPAISITLAASGEDDATLGDVHYEPQEDSDINWPTLYGPFVAQKYDPATGYLTLPADVSSKLVLGPGMVVVDDVGDMHQVTDVIDDVTLVIAKGITNPMQRATLRGTPPALTADMESVIERETYSIGVHMGGDAERLIWLYSIVKFILFAYKETLLEARNFERSSITSSDMGLNQSLSDEKELVYSRYIQITGYVRQQWPKSIKQKITSTATDVQASQVGVDDGDVIDISDDATFFG